MLHVIEFADGVSLIVESDDGAVVNNENILDKLIPKNTNLPSGAELTGSESSATKAAELLASQIRGLGRLANEVVNHVSPDEFELETHIKFSGDVNPIPFIVSAKGEGGLKLKLLWKKQENS